MKEYYGNYLGIVVSTQDPESRGRVKVYIPHIMPVLNQNLLKLFGDQAEDIISFNAVGGNLSNGMPENARLYLEKILPFAEPASPIIGGSSPGVLDSIGNFLQNAIGGGSYDKNAIGAGNTGVVAQPSQNNTSPNNPSNGKLDKANPSQLVPIGGGHYLNPYVAEKWKALKAEADAAGVKISVTDSYRTYAEQVDVAQRKGIYGKGGLAATPGRSNHGLGKALDLEFSGMTGYQWMLTNAPKYEFSQIHPNIPYGNSEFWHWQIPSAPMTSSAVNTPEAPPVNNNVAASPPPPEANLDSSAATDNSKMSDGSATPVTTTPSSTPPAPVTSTSPFGRITLYGYEKKGQADYDTNSANGIGIQNIKLVPNTSFAVSPDIESLFRANGIAPKDTVQLSLGNGNIISGTWDDRTAKNLSGRFDIYSPSKDYPHIDQPVMGFGKGDGAMVTSSAQVMTTTDVAPAPYDTTNVPKGVFCIPAIGALLWCFFREGNPLFPVYFAASYRSSEWSGAYKSASPGIGFDPSLMGNDTINKTSLLPNKGGGIISTEGKDLHEVSLVSFAGSHLKFSENHTMLYAADDFHAQTDGNIFNIGLLNRETHTKGIDNTVINGDCYIKVGNVTDSSVHDAINTIETLIGEINNEMLKP